MGRIALLLVAVAIVAGVVVCMVPPSRHADGADAPIFGGKIPPGYGTIIARLAWSYVPSEKNNKAFGRLQSYVAGPPKEGVQFMVKDSRKYASTGGWGFAQFNDGKPANVAVHNICFSCHAIIKDRDFVFTRYAP